MLARPLEIPILASSALARQPDGARRRRWNNFEGDCDMFAIVQWLRWQRRRIGRSLGMLALVGVLALAGCSSGGTASSATATPGAPTATATLAPSPTPTPQPTTCAQLPGFASASSLTLANMALPAGAVAPAPTTSFGGAGQYTITAYTICVPNNTSDLIVSTGKGPEPLT